MGFSELEIIEALGEALERRSQGGEEAVPGATRPA